MTYYQKRNQIQFYLYFYIYAIIKLMFYLWKPNIKHFYIHFKIITQGSNNLNNIFNLETDIQHIFRSSFSKAC